MFSTKPSNLTNYSTNGISISPTIPSAGEKVKLTYDGLLSKSGATDLSVRVGFGSDWHSLGEYHMTRTTDGFTANIPVAEAETMNVCFKDCANNWDNNSGFNYTFEIK